MTTTNLLIFAVTAATAVLAGWGHLACHTGRARAQRAATRPDTAAAAARVLRDYHGSERPRFRLVTTMLVMPTATLLVPMALGGWDRPIPTGLAFVGLGCLVLALGWLADFALRPLPVPTQPASLPAPSGEAKR
jgi:hypothetical protein